MNLFDRLKKLMKRSKLTKGQSKHKGASHQSVFRGEAEERVLTDQHELTKYVDSLGGVASDGLNRVV